MDVSVENNPTTVPQKLIKEALMTSDAPLEMSLYFFFISLRPRIDIKAGQGLALAQYRILGYAIHYHMV